MNTHIASHAYRANNQLAQYIVIISIYDKTQHNHSNKLCNKMLHKSYAQRLHTYTWALFTKHVKSWPVLFNNSKQILMITLMDQTITLNQF